MSESVSHPLEVINLPTSAASALSPAPALVSDAAIPDAIPAPMLAAPGALPADPHALVELIGRSLAPDADAATRAVACELWSRCAQVITATATAGAYSAAVAPVAPSVPPAALVLCAPGVVVPAAPALPMPPLAPPTTPIAMAAQALRQMSPDQLLELALQRLRAALPPGATVATPRGIQFPLVPVPPAAGDR